VHCNVIRTNKTWSETINELDDQLQLWGVTQWEVNYPSGARSTAWEQSEAARTVVLTYVKNGRSVTLTMREQFRAVDNLRVLYLAIEAMRLNERRGITDVIKTAYLQLDGPAQSTDPHELLEIRPDASVEVAEAAYKAKMRYVHPDAGGSQERAAQLNRAIQEIRTRGGA
jgi:hypothetical protein